MVTLHFLHLLWIIKRYEQNFLKGANVRCILSVIRITKDTICLIIVIRCTLLTVMDEIHQSILKTYLHNPLFAIIQLKEYLHWCIMIKLDS